MKQILTAVSLLLVLAIYSCGSNKKEKEIVVNVKTDTVEVYGNSKSAAFPGRIKAGDDINLSFRIAGPIASIHASPGNFVKKGDVLAQIDPRDYRTQLAATEAQYRQIKNEAERIITLYEKKGVSENDYYKAVYGLKQITAKYDAHKNALADTKLIAPFDGYVQKTYYSAKETVNAGMPVLSMIGTSVMEVEINIPSNVYAKKDQIESFICTSDIYPGKVYPLEMAGMNRKANLNELYTVYLNLITPEGYPPLTPGMNVKVGVQYKNTSQERYLVPINALISGKTGSSVWVYNANNSTISNREITTDGINNRGYAIVVEGLQRGEVVVSAGASSLKEGQKVKPIQQQSKTNTGSIL
ncbi:RND family efflux transporter, MFP subunit [Saccharicrinis carchari]|uniref:RND family efflux transporter, MFP subunit n=1 Tax=Saccharicrinis carchari TaxID=1168039 RepID=A0A521ATE8_SACCC|nr:efflux RND transporter periplasmic adaptor subunit [Saccharicrinis carchari]SMO38102.1 RND family efflux transporter, MFP subunit [Saccharicrinis carchari]